jgi:hypothetical protein
MSIISYGHTLQPFYTTKYYLYVPSSSSSSPNAVLGVVGGSGNVSTSSGPVDVNVLTLGEQFATLALQDLERVGTEEVSLGLDQASRQLFTSVSIL